MHSIQRRPGTTEPDCQRVPPASDAAVRASSCLDSVCFGSGRLGFSGPQRPLCRHAFRIIAGPDLGRIWAGLGRTWPDLGQARSRRAAPCRRRAPPPPPAAIAFGRNVCRDCADRPKTFANIVFDVLLVAVGAFLFALDRPSLAKGFRRGTDTPVPSRVQRKQLPLAQDGGRFYSRRPARINVSLWQSALQCDHWPHIR